MVELGGFVRDIFKLNEDSKNFRIFGPDETMSNRLMKVFERQTVTGTMKNWIPMNSLLQMAACYGFYVK